MLPFVLFKGQFIYLIKTERDQKMIAKKTNNLCLFALKSLLNVNLTGD